MTKLALALPISAALALAGASGCASKCRDEVCTVVGTSASGLDQGEGTPALESALYLPMGLGFGPDGNLYVVDWNNHRIRVLDGDSNTVSTVAGTGGATGDGPEGPALETLLNHPAAVAFDPAGGLLIAAWHNARIKRVDLAGGAIEHICGTGVRSFSGDGGPAELATLDLPSDVVIDSGGNVYIADQANNRIRRVDPAGIITTVVGTGLGLGTDPATGQPNPVCVGASDTLGTVDCWIDGDLDADDLDPATGATLNSLPEPAFAQAAPPAGRLALDADDNLYVADTYNSVIRKVDWAAGTITTIAGMGPTERGFSGDGGPAIEARLFEPADLDVGPDGTVYVADTANHCIRAIAPDGLISTVAGACGTSGAAANGARGEVLFHEPYGLALGPDGNLYVADTKNDVIRVVRLSAE